MAQQIDIKELVPQEFAAYCQQVQDRLGFSLYDVKQAKQVLRQRAKKSYKRTMGFYTLHDGEHVIFMNLENSKTPVSRMLLFLHEAAHCVVYKGLKGFFLKPHGKEWKREHRRLLYPVADRDFWGENFNDFVDYYNASPATYKMAFDRQMNGETLKHGEVYVKDLSPGDRFMLEGERFVVMHKKRTRYMVRSLDKSRYGTIHGQARVDRLTDEETEKVAKSTNKACKAADTARTKRNLASKLSKRRKRAQELGMSLAQYCIGKWGHGAFQEFCQELDQHGISH